jgi:hypothetical protein
MLLFVDINSFKTLRFFLAFFTTIIPFPYLITYLHTTSLSFQLSFVSSANLRESLKFWFRLVCSFSIHRFCSFFDFYLPISCGFFLIYFFTLIVKLLIVVLVCVRQFNGYLIYICFKFRSLSAWIVIMQGCRLQFDLDVCFLVYWTDNRLSLVEHQLKWFFFFNTSQCCHKLL